MAERGFHDTRLEDLGEEVGVSGPAVYRHFSGKEEILTELMLGISSHLFKESTQLLQGIADPRDQIEVLIDYHIAFALQHTELIRLHNRELFRLADEGRSQVRAAQGAYLKQWSTALLELNPQLGEPGARINAQLAVSLINSVDYMNVAAPESLLRRQLLLSARAVAGLR